jgi:hypothetical protein
MDDIGCRNGLGNELDNCDDDAKRDLIESWAEIIRVGLLDIGFAPQKTGKQGDLK